MRKFAVVNVIRVLLYFSLGVYNNFDPVLKRILDADCLLTLLQFDVILRKV